MQKVVEAPGANVVAPLKQQPGLVSNSVTLSATGELYYCRASTANVALLIQQFSN